MSTAAPLSTPQRMSMEEWASMPEDEPGELVDGVLVEDEVADWDHEDVVAWLMMVLGTWVFARGGRVYGSEGKYAVRPTRGRKPDISAFFAGTPLPPRRGPGRSPPDIMVEVISTGARDVRRDRIDKALEYAAFGVRYYWLIDPDDRTFEIFELQPGGRYLQVRAASEGSFDVPGCEGLRLDLDALWAHVDRPDPDAAGA
ncbi:MAG: Uma2 family endonuclease [Byssovorax sp.]